MDQTKEAARERKRLWVDVNEILFSYRSGFLCCGSSEQVVGMILYSQNVLAVKSSLREKVISSGKDVYIWLPNGERVGGTFPCEASCQVNALECVFLVCTMMHGCTCNHAFCFCVVIVFSSFFRLCMSTCSL